MHNIKEKGFRTRVLSRHPSHSIFRGKLRLPFRNAVRFGSTTALEKGYTFLNSIEGVQNSSSKSRMKTCFANAGVKCAEWVGSLANFRSSKEIGFPVVAKSHYGSRGKGNYLINNEAELKKFIAEHGEQGYIFEKFYEYSREYRLHINALNGTCFYTCRKMLKNEAPDDKRWQRHDDNCVWILENNPSFNKPSNWKEIIAECVKATKAVGLDFSAVDLKCQGSKHTNPKFIILETNSAPSMGKITAEKYMIEIPKMLIDKHK